MHSKSILSVIAALLLVLALTACGTETPPAPSETTAPETTAAPAEPVSLRIIEGGASEFQIVRAETTTDAIVKGATNFYKAVEEKTGVKLKLTTDWYKPGTESTALVLPEILIGETNRPETVDTLAALPEHSYTVTLKNNKLVIAGHNNSLTALALFDFAERILNDPDHCAEGKLIFTENDSFTVTLDGPITLKTLIEGKYTLACVSSGGVRTPKQGEYRIGQGSCSDGEHVYFVLRNKDDSGSKITKHRMDDGSLVAVSEVLDLGHGNDMTYDTKNGRLVVAHGQSEGQILTLVDPATLTLIKDINIPRGSGAIAYNESKDRYAISQGGKTLHILDGDFKHIVSYNRTDSTGYTAQGMGCDDDYVFFPMSGSKDNKVVVYTWEGKYVTTLTVPLSYESESMFWVNDKYYIAYNNDGEVVYETTFEIVYG